MTWKSPTFCPEFEVECPHKYTEEGPLCKTCYIQKHSNKYTVITYDKDGKQIKEKKNKANKTTKLFGDTILSEQRIITMRDNEEIYFYRNGVYEPNGDTYLKERAQQLLDPNPSTHDVNEIVNYIRRSKYSRRDELNPPPNIICLKNGILDVETLELSLHTPDLFFTSKIPIEFNKDAKCPKIEQFIKDVMPGWENTFYEYLGFCLYRQYFLEIFFILVGDGRNGKTRVVMLIQIFLGNDNVSTVPLKFLDDRFRKAALYGKLANIADDLSSESITYAGALKEATGGGPMQGENKYGKPFNFTNYAKMLYTCNEAPRFSEDTDALFRRPIMIKLPHIFVDNPQKGERKANPNIIEEITTSEELSGLLNKALEGLARLRERGYFTNVESIEKRRMAYIEESDPIKYIAMNYVYVNPGYMITKGDLYRVYCNYQWNKKKTPIADNWFSRLIGPNLPYVSEGMIDDPLDPRKTPRKLKVWHGLAFKGDTSDTHDTVSLHCSLRKGLVYGVIEAATRVHRTDTVSIVSTVPEPPPEEEDQVSPLSHLQM